ncbi:MAG: hypothetical protein AB1813_11380 [Verrucomicrobiota bacterium]
MRSKMVASMTAQASGKPMKLLVALGLSASALIFSGCATTSSTSTSSSPGSNGSAVDRALFHHVAAKDRVVFQYRAAATAMRRGQFEEAKRLLDDALLTAGSIVAGDKNAKKARGYFSEESKKTFKGEPYERVMAYYYRGILYWMDGELDNARACFRSAQLQDSDSENQQYASDYVLLDYLDGYATSKLRGDGSDAIKRARAAAKLAIPPEYPSDANAIFFVEFGQGPVKYATGQYNEQLRFRPGQSTAREVMIKAGTQAVHIGPYDDLSFQATTRGGRVMDHILENKAVFKSTTDTVGDAAIISGAVVTAANRQNSEVGLGLVAAGLLSKIVSAATTPSADTRMWDNLPQFLSFGAMKLPPGQHTVTVEFLDSNRRPLPNLTKTLTINVASPDRDTVVYVSDKSS